MSFNGLELRLELEVKRKLKLAVGQTKNDKKVPFVMDYKYPPIVS